MHSHKPVSPVVLQHIQALFEGKAFQTPIKVGATFGWAAATSYKHVSNETFPVRLRNVGGRQLVSIADYLQFVFGDKTVTPPTAKPSRGRPSNKAKAAALVMKGGV